MCQPARVHVVLNENWVRAIEFESQLVFHPRPHSFERYTSLSLSPETCKKTSFRTKHANFRGKLQMILRTTLIAFAGAAQWHGGACCEMQILCRLGEWELLKFIDWNVSEVQFSILCLLRCVLNPIRLSRPLSVQSSSSSTFQFHKTLVIWYFRYCHADPLQSPIAATWYTLTKCNSIIDK